MRNPNAFRVFIISTHLVFLGMTSIIENTLDNDANFLEFREAHLVLLHGFFPFIYIYILLIENAHVL